MSEEQRAATTRARQVVDVAREVLVEDGLDNFVMRRIADRCEMKLGNLQYYFATRDELLTAVARAELAADIEAMSELADVDEPEERLARTVGLLVDRWLNGDVSVYIPIGALALHDEHFARLWSEIYEHFYRTLDSIVSAIDPSALPEQVRQRTMLITSLVDGASIQAYASPQQPIKQRLSSEIQRISLTIADGS